MNNIDFANGEDKTSYNIAVCGMRYGRTLFQAEKLKKLIETNKIENLSIHVIDSEYKKRVEKALNKINNMFNNGDENKIIDDLLELEKILKGDNDE